MTTTENSRITVHAEQRRQERHVTTQSVHDAVAHGEAVRTATGWRYIGSDGTHVITDPTSAVVITVLGRIQRPAHYRQDAGVSRHRHKRLRKQDDLRGPRR